MFGSGGFFFQSNIPPAGSLGPTALVNGLHVDAGKGKLGGVLIENTLVSTLNSDISFGLSGWLGPSSPRFGLHLHESNQELMLGLTANLTPPNDGDTLYMTKGHVEFYNDYGQTFLIDTVSKNFQFGDIQNGSYLQIYGNTFSFLDLFGTAYINVNIPTTELTLANKSLSRAQVYLIGNFSTMGDVFGNGNNTSISLDDNVKIITMAAGNPAVNYFKIDATNLDYVFGSSTNNIDVNEAAGTINGNLGGVIVFQAQPTGIKTTQPSVNGAGVWQLGKKLAAAVVLDAANYIEVSIDGVVYKLALVN